MDKYQKVEIKEIENGYVVEHINPNGNRWSDKIEKYIENIEDVGVYIKIFYADIKKMNKENEIKNLKG